MKNNKMIFAVVGTAIAVVIILVIFLLIVPTQCSKQESLTTETETTEEHQANIEQYLLETITGTITDIALSAKVIIIQNQEKKEIGVAITEKTTLLDKNGNRMELKDFQPGESITAAGKWMGENTFIPSIIRKK
jgi:lipopolysaccharide export LptBFGC system permease protein LptF